MKSPVQRRLGDVFNPYGLFNGAFIPEALCRFTSLPAGPKICYGRLVRFAGEDGKCHPSVPTLASEIGVCARQCGTYLRQLEQQGLIRRVSRGKGQSNRFDFLWHGVFQDDQPRKHASALPRQDSSANPGRNLPPEESHRRNRNPASRGGKFSSGADAQPRPSMTEVELAAYADEQEARSA